MPGSGVPLIQGPKVLPTQSGRVLHPTPSLPPDTSPTKFFLAASPGYAHPTPPPPTSSMAPLGPQGKAHIPCLPATLRLLPHYFQPLAALSPLPGHPYPLSDTRLRPLPSQAGAPMPPSPGSSTVPVPPSLGPQQGLLTKQGVTISTEKQRFPPSTCLGFPPLPGRPLGVTPSPTMQRLMIGEVTQWMGETGAG